MTFEDMKKIVVDTLNCEEEKVTMEASLTEDLEADSLDAVELNMALEDAFGVSIPDEELARIFRDAYLINAYVSDRGVKLDSLELYEPVFSRYGYTAEDVRYTIGNFSRRKSAKLSDVVEQSIRLLEEESAYYKYEVGVLDTIDNVARRRFTRTVYSDSLIRVTRIKDTARLRVRIPDTRPGEYRVSFDYLIDSLDEILAPRMRVWLVEADSSRKGESSSILRK